ncbi:MAG: hypothetical protein QOH55_573 [Microbacteriaceae bacterium]|jgi:hypothetical protein|nr:hypothetical protein [Microbacteriaceae bacterium]
MKTVKAPARHPARTLVILGSCAVLAAIAVAIAVAMFSAGPPRRLGPAVADPMVTTAAPGWTTDIPHPTVTPTLTKQDTRTLTSMPWKFITLTNGGRDLTLVYGPVDGYCTVSKGFAVAYSKTSVEVWALGKTDTSQTACAASFVRVVATVRLKEPLGDRTLIHAPTDQKWPAGILD